MGFQHTFYLKRNESTLNDDNLDGRTYYWQCGARDLADVVRRFGSVKEDLPDGHVTFTPLQLLKLISAMSSVFLRRGMMISVRMWYGLKISLMSTRCHLIHTLSCVRCSVNIRIFLMLGILIISKSLIR